MVGTDTAAKNAKQRALPERVTVVVRIRESASEYYQ